MVVCLILQGHGRKRVRKGVEEIAPVLSIPASAVGFLCVSKRS
jgi:hypothetical protein